MTNKEVYLKLMYIEKVLNKWRNDELNDSQAIREINELCGD